MKIMNKVYPLLVYWGLSGGFMSMSVLIAYTKGVEPIFPFFVANWLGSIAMIVFVAKADVSESVWWHISGICTCAAVTKLSIAIPVMIIFLGNPAVALFATAFLMAVFVYMGLSLL